MRLTPKQVEVLSFLADPAIVDASAYAMRCSLGTLNALALKKMVRLNARPGDMAFPRNALWSITEAGCRALSEQRGAGND